MSSRRGRLGGLFALLGALAIALPGAAQAEPELPPGFQDEVVFSGLEQPTNFRFAPDGRIFVAEKPGRIKVFDDLEDTTPTVFADLRAEVYDNGDRGLLGLELDPKFDEGRPYVYALYTWDHVLGEPWDPTDPKYGTPGVSGDPGCPSQNSSASCLVSGRLVRLVEDGSNPGHAVKSGGLPQVQELVQGWCQQFSSHSVGDLQFGPEGALYVSGGDGASFESIPDYGQLGTPANPCGDAPTPVGTGPESSPGVPLPGAKGGALRSQNLELLNGAILRLDPDTGAAFPGNPLAASGDENTRRTVAKGFRNPFRFTLDPVTGEVYSGNVGSSEIEEIDRFQAPPSSLFNSGWPCFEGIERNYEFRELGLDVCGALYAGSPQAASLPLFSYSHQQSVVPGDECPTDSGSAITGVALYGGGQLPAAYSGALFFADSVRGCVWVMFPGEDGRPDPNSTVRFLREGRIYPAVKIIAGPDGYLYYANLFSNEGAGDGEIHRIAYRPNAPTARLEATPPFGLYDGGGVFKAVLDAGGSVDPNSGPLSFEWDLDEDGDFEPIGGVDEKQVAFTKAEQEARAGEGKSPNRVIAVRVEDAEGLSSVAKVTVYPGDKPPVPTITKPLPSVEWGVGDEIDADSEAKDALGNPITSPLSYYWQVRMAHCPDPEQPSACHVHPLQTFSGIRRPHFTAPQHDYPSFIELVLRVSDDRGLSGTAIRKIDPRTIDLSLVSDPPGVRLLAGSVEGPAPLTVPAIDGSKILLSAPQSTTIGSRLYEFSGWSDGGARAHPIEVGGSLTEYTAQFSLKAAVPPSSSPLIPPPTVLVPGPKLPALRIGRHPSKLTRATTARFSFGPLAGSRFRCKLDRGRYGGCLSPRIYRGLKPGRHVFRVRAVSGSGLPARVDWSPAVFRWRVLG